MAKGEVTLFNPTEYENPQANIPILLGVYPDAFLNGSQFARIEVAEGATFFRSIDGPSGCQSVNYATENTGFHDDFKFWTPGPQPSYEELVGHVAGFPTIRNQSGHTETAIHMWANNSDVLADTYAVKLSDVAKVELYPELRNDVEVCMGEVAMDGIGISWYEITLKDRHTGNTTVRNASYEDLEHIATTWANEPVTVFELEDKAAQAARFVSYVSKSAVDVEVRDDTL